MRLKQYLKESIEIQEVIDLIQPKIKPLYNFLKKKNWIVNDKELITFLNKIFKGDDIGYVFRLGNSKGKVYRYISYGEFNITKGKVNIYIDLVKGVSEFFKRFSKEGKDKIFLDIRKNQFFSDLLNMFSHEFRHIGQIVSSKLKAKFNVPDLESGEGMGEYYGSDTEIDAFALQAAIEFMKYGKHGGTHKTYGKVFYNDDKRYKRFLKKVEGYKKKLKKMKLDKILKV